jgi:hypothetical protein
MKKVAQRLPQLKLASRWATIIAIGWLVSGSDSHAQVRVSGVPESLVIDAHNASLNEVIRTITATIHVRITLTSEANLTISGRYSGSLRRVLSRMLNDHNYILDASGGRIKIILVDGTNAGSNRLAHSRVPAVSAVHVRANNLVHDTRSRDQHFQAPIQGWRGGFVYKPSANAK